MRFFRNLKSKWRSKKWRNNNQRLFNNKNIVNNKFAIEKQDYIPFAIEGERYSPKPKTDYKITSDFAKKLSMTGNTERHEQAKQYFIACEQGLKVVTQKLQSSVNLSKFTNAREYEYSYIIHIHNIKKGRNIL